MIFYCKKQTNNCFCSNVDVYENMKHEFIKQYVVATVDLLIFIVSKIFNFHSNISSIIF